MRSKLITGRTSCLLGSFLLLLIAGGVSAGAPDLAGPERVGSAPADDKLGSDLAGETDETVPSETFLAETADSDLLDMLTQLYERKAQVERFAPRLLPAPERELRVTTCLTARDPQCAQARAIATMGACVRSEDCPAVDAWKDLMGAPAVELAVPVLTRRPPVGATSESDPHQPRGVEDDATN